MMEIENLSFFDVFLWCNTMIKNGLKKKVISLAGFKDVDKSSKIFSILGTLCLLLKSKSILDLFRACCATRR
jgi:hypothetical protein